MSSPAPAPQAASASTPAYASASVLAPVISSTRSLLESGVESVADTEQSAASYWNAQLAQPANQQLQGTAHTQHNTTQHNTTHSASRTAAPATPRAARVLPPAHSTPLCVLHVCVLLGVRSQFHRLRAEYGGAAVLASTVAVLGVSLPLYGRFAAVRNAALTALAVGWLVRPSLVTGMIAASTDSIRSTQPNEWSRRGEQIVRQQQTGSNTANSTASNSSTKHSLQ